MTRTLTILRTYVRVRVPGGKLYYGLDGTRWLRRPFCTATAAKRYAAKVHYRYQRWLKAAEKKGQ